MEGMNKYIFHKIPYEPKETAHSTSSFLKSHSRNTTAKKNKETDSLWKVFRDFVSLDRAESSRQEQAGLHHESEKVEQVMPGTSMLIRDQVAEEPSLSSYTLASDQSMLSEQVDNWIRGNVTPTESAGIQFSRVPVFQRSTMATSNSFEPGSVWYLLAMLLPLCSINNYLQWTCNTNNLINAAQLILTQLTRYCSEVQVHIRRIAEDRLARDLFATLMDIILVLYAMGFLILYLYQATALV